MSDGYGIAPEVVRDSHMLGTLCSQFRAYRGDFGEPDELGMLVDSGVLEASPGGLVMLERFGEAFGGDRGPGIWERDAGGWIILTPTLLSMETINTVGLGDCLTAGTVLSEIA